MLKLNDDKTEVLFVASAHFQKSLEKDACLIILPNVCFTITISKEYWSHFWRWNAFETTHFNSLSNCSLFHLRSTGQIRRYLTEDAFTTRLVHSLVSTRIDYCNSLLVNLPACSLQELQRVLNTAARTVSLWPKRDDIIPVLISLHWLPIEHRIHYKVILFVFRCLHGLAPSYLVNC